MERERQQNDSLVNGYVHPADQPAGREELRERRPLGELLEPCRHGRNERPQRTRPAQGTKWDPGRSMQSLCVCVCVYVVCTQHTHNTTHTQHTHNTHTTHTHTHCIAYRRRSWHRPRRRTSQSPLRPPPEEAPAMVKRPSPACALAQPMHAGSGSAKVTRTGGAPSRLCVCACGCGCVCVGGCLGVWVCVWGGGGKAHQPLHRLIGEATLRLAHGALHEEYQRAAFDDRPNECRHDCPFLFRGRRLGRRRALGTAAIFPCRPRCPPPLIRLRNQGLDEGGLGPVA